MRKLSSSPLTNAQERRIRAIVRAEIGRVQMRTYKVGLKRREQIKRQMRRDAATLRKMTPEQLNQI